MEEKDFKTECDEWLNPINYSCSIFTPNKDYYLYNYFDMSDCDYGLYPLLECRNKNGHKTVQLSGGNLKMLLYIQSSELSFGHKDLNKFIDTFKHYAMVCNHFKPF